MSLGIFPVYVGICNKSSFDEVRSGMTSPFLLGLGIFIVCGIAGVGIALFFAKRQDLRKDKIAKVLAQFPGRWSSDFLDPKFGTRALLKRSYSFGDIPVDCTPDGLLINDNGAYYFLCKKENSSIARVANKSYSLDFIAAYSNYFWIQGGDGKFQLRGSLYKGEEFKSLVRSWGWEIYNGIPEGAELPKNFKGKLSVTTEPFKEG